MSQNNAYDNRKCPQDIKLSRYLLKKVSLK